MSLLDEALKFNHSCVSAYEGREVSLDPLVRFLICGNQLALQKKKNMENVALVGDFINEEMIASRGCDPKLLEELSHQQELLRQVVVEKGYTI